MDHLDMGDQIRSPDLTEAGVGDSLGHTSQPPSYSQPYPDSSLLQFSSPDSALGVPPLPFSPADPNAFPYALTSNTIAAIPQPHQSDESKKDIKRRTKTGCLTCRKRRIKCDEAQPACNNCRKSKRECQGYDPLFRNQQSPAAIQPASSRAKQAAVQKLPSATQSAYPAPPVGYAAVQPPAYPNATMAQPHNDPATYDFSAHIDPALQSQGPSGFGQQMGQGLFSSSNDDFQIEVKPTPIEELMQIGAPAPPAPSSTLSNDNKLDMKQLFSYYAGGLNKFLETQWMQQHGWARLQKTQSLIDQYNLLLSRMAYTAEQHPYENQINLTIEAHIIWGTLELSKWASEEAKAEGDSTNEPKKPLEVGEHIDVHETTARFEILKALISNTYIAQSQAEELSKFDSNIPKQFNALSKQLLTRERNFWKHTARFLTLDTSTAAAEALDTALGDMRGLLESKENRDIMYSVAVMRVWPQRLMAREQTLKNEGNSNPQLDADDLKKVEIAKAFITQQASGRGTTAPSQRICGMILKGWHNVNNSFMFTGA